ncbi:HupE/UreJ family protein [Roseibium sp.]|uniref:HupE/UreJ family protein n=1 Tax=Roseibium sp. TaxID=1936156 RepID=UPI003D0F7EF2
MFETKIYRNSCKIPGLLILWLLAIAWPALQAQAHELRPAIVSAHAGTDGTFRVEISFNFEAYAAGIGAEHKDTGESANSGLYDELRALEPAALERRGTAALARLSEDYLFEADGVPIALRLTGIRIPATGDTGLARISKAGLAGQLPPAAKTLKLTPPPEAGQLVFRLFEAGEDKPAYAKLLPEGQREVEVALSGPEAQPVWQTFADYLRLGFQHIVPKGLDHILFIVGLFLLAARLRPLLWQVTSFTLAHSVTLFLGIAGIISVPGYIVEPLIAASIIYVAVENLMTSRLHVWRPFVIFSFGLLHGLGFSGVLAEIGLPEGQFAAALIAFNVGVEIGQITVLGACFLAVGYWFHARSWYRSAVTVPGSLVVAATGTFWFLERTL